eukprot:1146063-Pelagomonas_calceolata.AAC.5
MENTLMELLEQLPGVTKRGNDDTLGSGDSASLPCWEPLSQDPFMTKRDRESQLSEGRTPCWTVLIEPFPLANNLNYLLFSCPQ